MPIVAKRAVEIPVKSMQGPIIKSEIVDGENKSGERVQYVQCIVATGEKVEGWDGNMRFSVPAYLTQNSGLGRLLGRLNVPFTFGEEFDETTLEGIVVAFDTKREGNFTNAVVDSIHAADE